MGSSLDLISSLVHGFESSSRVRVLFLSSNLGLGFESSLGDHSRFLSAVG